jgi:uroporphyrinogen III methyltransferase/synthase
MSTGICYLVGAGPGDPGLMTLRGRELLERAEVLVYDYLANPAFLSWAPEGCEKIYVGKKANQHTLTQDEINALLVRKVGEGKRVVRLKGGDPFVFGRGGEEAEALRAEGLKFEAVPGVTSGVAAPAYAGIPVTHRDFTSSVTFVTGHEEPGKTESAVNWKALAELRNTLVMYMGVQRLEANLNELMKHGLPPDTPAAAVRWGTTPRQKQLVATAGTLAKKAASAGLSAPAIIVIGAVVSCTEQLSWFAQRPLFGKKILATRSSRQAGKLRGLLEEQGAEVWEWPMLRTRPANLESAWKEKLAGAGWVFFTSPNGVEAFREAMEAAGGDARSLAGKKLGVVGPTTKKALAAWGLRADFMPDIYTAEGLLAGWLRECGRNAGQRVLFAAGSQAGKGVEEGLRREGHLVERVDFYLTENPGEENAEARRLVETGGLDWVVFNSSSAVQAFFALGIPHADNLKWASFGQATSEALKEAGVVKVHCEAPESTMEALVAELTRVELTSSQGASH